MSVLGDLPTIYLYRDVVDFRKAVDGLSVIVEQEMELDPFSEAAFVFCNRHRDRIKMLYWDKTGFCLWYKRLEKAKFQWPRRSEDGVLQWSEREFKWLLEGFDVLRMKAHKAVDFRAVS